jgi:hypothetical protein
MKHGNASTASFNYSFTVLKVGLQQFDTLRQIGIGAAAQNGDGVAEFMQAAGDVSS